MIPSSDRRGSCNHVVGHLMEGLGVGGAQVYVAHLANTHAELGRDSRVIVLNTPGELSKRLSSAVKVQYLGFRRASIRNPLRFLFSLFAGYRKLTLAVEENGIEVLQTHLPDTNLWGLLLSLTGKCRVVITIHNNNFLPAQGGTKFGSMVKRYAYRLMVRRCGAVVTVSREVRNSLQSQLNLTDEEIAKIHVVTNGVPIPPLASPEERMRTRATLGVNEDELLILGAGRLTEAKNFQLLVEAMALLREQGLYPKVLIAGEGHLRLDLERRIRELDLVEQFNLPGNLENLGEVMQASDLLAMPSLYEGLPLVLLESMARGRPVVGTKISGLIDVLEDGQHGLLVDEGDVEGFASSLAKLLKDPGLRSRMGKECRLHVEKHFDFQRVYSDLCKVYNLAAGSPGVGDPGLFSGRTL
ncbi:MAG: glycosyltransferase family 4 protein [Gemmatimonadales bacterium]|nr:glycosyltransferase family 4 protein [Gemmatimonadales bacterium]